MQLELDWESNPRPPVWEINAVLIRPSSLVFIIYGYLGTGIFKPHLSNFRSLKTFKSNCMRNGLGRGYTDLYSTRCTVCDIYYSTLMSGSGKDTPSRANIGRGGPISRAQDFGAEGRQFETQLNQSNYFQN